MNTKFGCAIFTNTSTLLVCIVNTVYLRLLYDVFTYYVDVPLEAFIHATRINYTQNASQLDVQGHFTTCVWDNKTVYKKSANS